MSHDNDDVTPAQAASAQPQHAHAPASVRTLKSRRGFAAMDPNKQKEIASLGGRAAHEKGTAHEWSSGEARTAGSKGGKVAHAKGTAHEWSSEEARMAGRKGGEAAHKVRQQGNAH